MKRSLDIAALAAGYASGTVTPEQVVGDVYDRIEAQGTSPVWISLRARADALNAAANAPRGPLYGIPFAVKDNIEVAGLATTCACPAYAYQPAVSASVVARLEAAGAIAIGKTNLDQFATGLVGVRSPYGIPSSVFNADYVSGGSSSGSAVAVAGGLVSFSLGTDTAGSGRVPAAFNNIVGWKPTKGVISANGVVPACRTLDTVSIFALTVADAARVAAVASAFDAGDAFARSECNRVVPPQPRGCVRLGVPRQALEFCGDENARALYQAAIERARGLGAEIVPFDFTPFQETAKLLYQGPWVAERLAAIKDFADSHRDAMHDVVGGIILGATSLTAAETFQGMYRLAELTRAAEGAWQGMDMMLLPSAPTTYRIADVLADPVRLNANLGLYTNFVNLMDLSALAVPAGFNSSGLPFGVTLIGPALAEPHLAAFGDRLHRTLSDARLGGTEFALADTPPLSPPLDTKKLIEVAVVGAHLTGQPLNGQLVERQARMVRTARTAAGYSFYALANTKPEKPGLVFDGSGAGGIEVEIWALDEAAFGSFVALIPAPLGIGTLQLDDGTSVKGFVCEAYAVHDAEDITAWGGWRAWRARTALA
ncbi:MAG: allophanate hydrolase [Hyphomicrobium sp.]